jgi:hypothetical protein
MEDFKSFFSNQDFKLSDLLQELSELLAGYFATLLFFPTTFTFISFPGIVFQVFPLAHLSRSWLNSESDGFYEKR